MESPRLPDSPVVGGTTLVVDSPSKLAQVSSAVVPAGTTIKIVGSMPGRLVLCDGTKGVRVVGQSDSMIVQTTPDPVVVIGLGCQDISIDDLSIQRSTLNQAQMGLVVMGYDHALTREAKTVDELPNRIQLSNLKISGLPLLSQRYGILGNARHLTIISCSIEEIHEVGADSQGVLITNTPGPVLISNCSISAAGENIMAGGSNPTIPGLQIADLTIQNNHLWKSMDWQSTNWQLKNLLELKACDRALITGNLLENCWLKSQDGTAILLTPRNLQYIDNVSISENDIVNVGSGILISGEDDTAPSPRPTGSVLLSSNRWFNVAGLPGSGRVYDFVTPKQPIGSIQIINDTWMLNPSSNAKSFMNFEGVAPAVKSLAMINCMGNYGLYGLIGSGTGPGRDSLTKWVGQFGGHNNTILRAGADDGSKWPEGFVIYH